MQFVILGLLLTGPLSLYDVQKSFRSGISLFYSASAGSIQRALRGLVDEGSVSVAAAGEGPRRRKLHTVTAEGRARWRAWMLAPVPDGSNAETTILAKVFLLGRLERPQDREAVLDALQAQVAAAVDPLEELAAQLASLAPELSDEHRRILAYQRATLEYGIKSHRLMDTWLDDVRGSRA